MSHRDRPRRPARSARRDLDRSERRGPGRPQGDERAGDADDERGVQIGTRSSLRERIDRRAEPAEPGPGRAEERGADDRRVPEHASEPPRERPRGRDRLPGLVRRVHEPRAREELLEVLDPGAEQTAEPARGEDPRGAERGDERSLASAASFGGVQPEGPACEKEPVLALRLPPLALLDPHPRPRVTVARLPREPDRVGAMGDDVERHGAVETANVERGLDADAPRRQERIRRRRAHRGRPRRLHGQRRGGEFPVALRGRQRDGLCPT